MDSAELSEQLAVLQPNKIQAATAKLNAVKFDPLILFDSKRDIAEMLSKETEV